LESLITKGLDEVRNAVIRFRPGSDQIFVRARLNRDLWQDFLVDTGANCTTIPSSTFIALGLKITNRTKISYVTTASGYGLAFQVMLDSIEIQGIRVRNLEVLIVDMPGSPDEGLLGTNFLNRFNMEIDNENGILRLSPR
jgi:clan AA aspartic protease (TIGR02281 family)